MAYFSKEELEIIFVEYESIQKTLQEKVPENVFGWFYESFYQVSEKTKYYNWKVFFVIILLPFNSLGHILNFIEVLRGTDKVNGFNGYGGLIIQTICGGIGALIFYFTPYWYIFIIFYPFTSLLCTIIFMGSLLGAHFCEIHFGLSFRKFFRFIKKKLFI
jgi:hypothetical protein